MSARRPPPHGQHFLHDPALARRIVEALEADAERVLEIGPGRGALTRGLARICRELTAVELDPVLADELRTDPELEGVTVETGDILSRALPGWLAGEPERFLLIGNLPYGITSAVLFAYCAAAARIPRAVMMMQREVAERVTAEPGSRTYGITSVAAALVARREKLFTIGTGAFSPPPRVESAVIRLASRSEPLTGRPGTPSFDQVMRVVRTAFGQRRKKLRNALRAGSVFSGDPATWEAAAGIDLDRRAEMLSPEEFCRLAAVMNPPDGV